MKKTLISVVLKIFTAVLLLILIMMLFLNISTRMSVKKINQGGFVKSGYASVVIASGSMEPVLAIDDLLIIKGADLYKPGDIVTYISDKGYLITHRIKEVSENGYITQGEANNVPDNEVPAQRILGKNIFVLTGAGMITSWIFSPVNIIFLACIILLLWVLARINSASKN